MDLFQEIGDNFVLTILPAVLSLLAAYAIYGLNKLIVKVKAQTSAIVNEEQRALLVAALEDVDNLTTKTVTTIEQTTAKALRQAVKGGLASHKELESLSTQAISEIRSTLRPEVTAVIEKNYGSVSNYLKKCIETKVLELKLADQGGARG